MSQKHRKNALWKLQTTIQCPLLPLLPIWGGHPCPHPQASCCPQGVSTPADPIFHSPDPTQFLHFPSMGPATQKTLCVPCVVLVSPPSEFVPVPLSSFLLLNASWVFTYIISPCIAKHSFLPEVSTLSEFLSFPRGNTVLLLRNAAG